ncbi:transcriptional regulator [Antricoccus suffuscus]|uniref:Transcriptional regulator n=2 Tax=Antricoccus suffuscus TaxID=1629062 RepID=A0A2T1A0R7_9ACTN|nr:transcriptional regulator [Antricoccus suffuscus]
MGPDRVAPERPFLATLSAPRAALMKLLDARDRPATIAELSADLGQHPNTVREHADALVELGYVERTRAAAVGRGRPAWLYASSDAGTGEGSEYAGLASALAAQIARNSRRPTDDAIRAGRDWGKELARARPIEGRPTLPRIRRATLEMLNSLRFAPESAPRGRSVRLTTCPLLDAANKYPDIVCGVHLGIIRGAIEEYGADGEETQLVAFSEPGACRLTLHAKSPQ